MLISIHAPLTGCDAIIKYHSIIDGDFNPRTPDGVRQFTVKCDKFTLENFNPRTPDGVRLYADDGADEVVKISIHAPLTGCDAFPECSLKAQHDFNPRTPDGVRLRRGAIL